MALPVVSCKAVSPRLKSGTALTRYDTVPVARHFLFPLHEMCRHPLSSLPISHPLTRTLPKATGRTRNVPPSLPVRHSSRSGPPQPSLVGLAGQRSRLPSLGSPYQQSATQPQRAAPIWLSMQISSLQLFRNRKRLSVSISTHLNCQPARLSSYLLWGRKASEVILMLVYEVFFTNAAKDALNQRPGNGSRQAFNPSSLHALRRGDPQQVQGLGQGFLDGSNQHQAGLSEGGLRG